MYARLLHSATSDDINYDGENVPFLLGDPDLESPPFTLDKV